MHISIYFACMALLFISYCQEIEGVCCRSKGNPNYIENCPYIDVIKVYKYCNSEICGDGTPPTPHCGKGPCNIFGCNCDGGCR